MGTSHRDDPNYYSRFGLVSNDCPNQFESDWDNRSTLSGGLARQCWPSGQTTFRRTGPCHELFGSSGVFRQLYLAIGPISAGLSQHKFSGMGELFGTAAIVLTASGNTAGVGAGWHADCSIDSRELL